MSNILETFKKCLNNYTEITDEVTRRCLKEVVNEHRIITYKDTKCNKRHVGSASVRTLKEEIRNRRRYR